MTDLDPARLLSYLIAKRDFYGADTPIGHRCSSILELLDNRRKGAARAQLMHIDANLAKLLSEIEKLCADAAAQS